MSLGACTGGRAHDRPAPSRLRGPSVSLPATGPPSPGSTYVASSRFATPGIAYEITIDVICGLEGAIVDFDGSLWDPIPPPGGFPDRFGGLDPGPNLGTIVLVTHDRSQFRNRSRGTTIDYDRTAGPKIAPSC